jgi:hypothetical protein
MTHPLVSVTYPPEMLPMPDEGDEVDVFVCENHHDKDGPCPNCRRVLPEGQS